MAETTVLGNLVSSATIDEIVEWFDATEEQVVAVLEFAARGLDPPTPHLGEGSSVAPIEKSQFGLDKTLSTHVT